MVNKWKNQDQRQRKAYSIIRWNERNPVGHLHLQWEKINTNNFSKMIKRIQRMNIKRRAITEKHHSQNMTIIHPEISHLTRQRKIHLWPINMILTHLTIWKLVLQMFPWQKCQQWLHLLSLRLKNTICLQTRVKNRNPRLKRKKNPLLLHHLNHVAWPK